MKTQQKNYKAKKHNVLKSQIIKSYLRSHNKELYNKHTQKSSNLFTLELVHN